MDKGYPIYSFSHLPPSEPKDVELVERRKELDFDWNQSAEVTLKATAR
jgi:hypothetical protein